MIRQKKTIAFDFDNVIHLGYKGYRNGEIYGEINTPLLEYIFDILMPKYYICIFSCRSAEQIVNYMNNFNKDTVYKNIKFELKDDNILFWNKPNVIGVTNKKPPAILYVDDKAYRFVNVKSLDNFLKRGKKIWTKKE